MESLRPPVLNPESVSSVSLASVCLGKRVVCTCKNVRPAGRFCNSPVLRRDPERGHRPSDVDEQLRDIGLGDARHEVRNALLDRKARVAHRKSCRGRGRVARSHGRTERGTQAAATPTPHRLVEPAARRDEEDTMVRAAASDRLERDQRRTRRPELSALHCAVRVGILSALGGALALARAWSQPEDGVCEPSILQPNGAAAGLQAQGACARVRHGRPRLSLGARRAAGRHGQLRSPAAWRDRGEALRRVRGERGRTARHNVELEFLPRPQRGVGAVGPVEARRGEQRCRTHCSARREKHGQQRQRQRQRQQAHS